MKYNVTDIEFDLDDDYDYDMSDDDTILFKKELQLDLQEKALGVWEADDEDDLIEEITAATGWCINSIDYEIQLK